MVKEIAAVWQNDVVFQSRNKVNNIMYDVCSVQCAVCMVIGEISKMIVTANDDAMQIIKSEERKKHKINAHRTMKKKMKKKKINNNTDMLLWRSF